MVFRAHIPLFLLSLFNVSPHFLLHLTPPFSLTSQCVLSPSISLFSLASYCIYIVVHPFFFWLSSVLANGWFYSTLNKTKKVIKLSVYFQQTLWCLVFPPPCHQILVWWHKQYSAERGCVWTAVQFCWGLYRRVPPRTRLYCDTDKSKNRGVLPAV